MATTLYFRNTTADISRGQGDADLVGTTRQWSPLGMSTTKGAAATSQTRTSIAGATVGIEAGTTIEWISPPIDADVTIAGDISMNMWCSEANMSANASISAVIERLNSQGARASTVGTFPLPTEMSTTNTAQGATVTPTSTNMLKGDRFRVRVFFDDAPTTTMAATYALTFRYDGPTAFADGESYLLFTETFGFQDVSGSAVGSAIITQASGTGENDLFGGSGSWEKVAQSFTLGSTTTLAAADLRLRKAGSPTDNVTLDVVSTLDGSSLATATIAASGLGATAADHRFTFTTPAALVAGTYYLQLTRSGARDTTNRAVWIGDSGSDVYAGGASAVKSSGSWGAGFLLDQRFTVYEAAATGSTLYLTNTASAVSTASVDREAWTSRGAGVQTDATNDAAGPTAPIQVSDTLGGTVVDWFSKPLTAFTLDGLILCNIRALETNAGSNAAVRCEIAVTAGDGTGAVVWGAATDNAELGTSEAAQTFYVAGDATSVTSGQRLRIRLSFDDAPGVAMANAGDLTLYYAGTSAAASGDTYITLPQTVTEASSGTNNTVTHTAPNLAFVGGTALKAIRRSHTAPNLQLVGGTHTATKGGAAVPYTVAQVAPNFQLIGGTHLKSTGRKVAHVGPNFQLAGGVHLKSTGRKVTHVGPNLGLLGGTHLRTLNRRITHVGANLQLQGGTHTPLKAKVVVQVAPNFALAGGTHLKSLRRSHTAPNLAFAGGTHTALKAKVVAHAAANLQLVGGTHLLRFDRRPQHVAANLAFLGGTHVRLMARRVAHVGANLALVGGTHVALKAKVVTQTAPNFQLVGGTHLRTLNRRPQHVAPNLQFAAGNHAALTGEIVGHTAPNLALAGGTHLKALRRSHTAANLQLAGGTHLKSAGRRSVHVAPNLAFQGGTHAANKTTGSVNYTATQVAPNLSLAGGTHTASPGRKVAHVGPNLALAGGVHGRTLNRRPIHVAPNLAFAAGNHAALTGEIVGHTAPNLAFAAGTARLASRRSHTAPNFALAGGTHTARKTKTVVQVAPAITLQAGTHRLASRRSHTAPNLQLQGGTHTASRARFVVHTAAQFQLQAGTHARRVLKALVAPNLQLAAGTHLLIQVGSDNADDYELGLASAKWHQPGASLKWEAGQAGAKWTVGAAEVQYRLDLAGKVYV